MNRVDVEFWRNISAASDPPSIRPSLMVLMVQRLKCGDDVSLCEWSLTRSVTFVWSFSHCSISKAEILQTQTNRVFVSRRQLQFSRFEGKLVCGVFRDDSSAVQRQQLDGYKSPLAAILGKHVSSVSEDEENEVVWLSGEKFSPDHDATVESLSTKKRRRAKSLLGFNFWTRSETTPGWKRGSSKTLQLIHFSSQH